MPTFLIRPFRRHDREQLTRLVNTHAAAVMPGAHISVNTVLQQLEREPDEFIVDPWVAERVTVVAEQDGSVAAAALIARYRDDPDVGDAYRGTGEIKWLLFRPIAPSDNPHWHDGHDAAQVLLTSALEQFASWRVTTVMADGALPYPGVYGIPAQWPHIEQLFVANKFVHAGATEIVLIADTAAIAPAGGPPHDGLRARRSVGINGTRITADVDDKPVGYIEIGRLDVERFQPSGLADIGNLEIFDDRSRDDIADWLICTAADWLRLGQTDRLLAYASPDEAELLAQLDRHGFVQATVTRVGWRRIAEADEFLGGTQESEQVE